METGNPQKTGEQLLWRITQWRVVLRHNLLSIPVTTERDPPLTQIRDKQVVKYDNFINV